MFSRLVHVVACVSTLFLFRDKLCIIAWIGHIGHLWICMCGYGNLCVNFSLYACSQFFVVETGFHYVALAGPELAM